MSIVYRANLNMDSGTIPTAIHVGQYDDDFSIVFTPYSTNGVFTIEEGTTAEIRGTKRDGNGYSPTQIPQSRHPLPHVQQRD